MVVDAVPLQKIRANIDTLSYLVPESLQRQISVGQRVIIPFRNQEVVGIVWKVSSLTSAKKLDLKLKSLVSVIDSKSFLSDKHRQILKFISDYYLCPLPTVLKTALPEKFCKLTKRVQPQNISWENKNQPQQLILAPYLDYPGLEKLRLRPEFLEISQKISDKNQADIWQDIFTGKKLVIFGTYSPIYLPYQNLKQITIFEPENNLYKYEMAPKIHITQVAKKMAKIYQIKLNYKSYLSLSSLSSLSSKLQIADISNEWSLINYQTEMWLNHRLKSGRKIIIFYNLLDQEISPGKTRFGIHSFVKELKKNYSHLKISAISKDFYQIDLNCQIIVGTAKLLNLPFILEGDLLIPNLDLTQGQPDSQEQKILAQISKLSRFSQSVLIQTKKPDQPLIEALRNKKISEYLQEVKLKAFKRGKFPFGFWIKLSCTHSEEKICQVEAEKITNELEKNFKDEIQVYGPTPSVAFENSQKHRWLILIKLRQNNPEKQILPSLKLRSYLLKLKTPWQVDPHPVNLI